MSLTIAPHHIAVHSSDSGKGHIRVAVAGSLTVRTCSEVRQAIMTAGVRPSMNVDLRRVTHLDAAGLVAVTAPVLAARRQGCRVTVLLPPHAEARRVADLAGVVPLLNSVR